MDKETLSNYGWIVICVLVLAVMVALATPFGSYIASAVESTTQGLFDVEQGALSAAGIDIADQSFEGGESSENNGLALEAGAVIPEGGTYYVGVTSYKLGDYTGATATYTASQTMPTIINTGDVFVYGDYEYRYNNYYNDPWKSDSSQNGWGVCVIDDEKTEYGAILESINGHPITDTVGTFAYCTSLETAPTIPNSVTNMSSTFWGCTSLKTAPAIPSSVTDISNTFYDCTSLKTYVGSTDADGDFSNYVIPTSVTSMYCTFWGCTSLKTAPAIPSSVTGMSNTFRECTNLTGNIEINATPTSYSACLKDTQIATISGSCPQATKDAILATK